MHRVDASRADQLFRSLNRPAPQERIQVIVFSRNASDNLFCFLPVPNYFSSASECGFPKPDLAELQGYRWGAVFFRRPRRPRRDSAASSVWAKACASADATYSLSSTIQTLTRFGFGDDTTGASHFPLEELFTLFQRFRIVCKRLRL